MNTPTLTWVYTRTERIERKGKNKTVIRPTSAVPPIQNDVVYLNENLKWVTKKYFGHKQQGQAENETVGKPEFFYKWENVRCVHVNELMQVLQHKNLSSRSQE